MFENDEYRNLYIFAHYIKIHIIIYYLKSLFSIKLNCINVIFPNFQSNLFHST